MRCIVICVKVYLLFFAISSVNLYSDSGQTRKHPFIKHQLQTINFFNSFRFCLSCTVLREKMADVRPSHRPELVSGTVDSCRPRYFTSICDGEMKVAISFRRSAARPVRYCHVPGASRSTAVPLPPAATAPRLRHSTVRHFFSFLRSRFTRRKLRDEPSQSCAATQPCSPPTHSARAIISRGDFQRCRRVRISILFDVTAHLADWRRANFEIYTDHFSGSDRAVGVAYASAFPGTDDFSHRYWLR